MLLQVGSLTHFKRPDVTIEALNLLAKKGHDVRLVFIGPEVAETKRRLTDLLGKYDLSDRTLFLGPRSDPELRQAYAACDVFLFPSFQSWSLVTTEAMASRKPVIVSRRCGVAEIIENGVNGFVADHGDYGQIAGYVEALMTDGRLRSMVADNALATVKNRLTWQRYAENMEAVFDRAIATRR
jgi:glycosyltransferase involved in cell wall biosynthesis